MVNIAQQKMLPKNTGSDSDLLKNNSDPIFILKGDKNE